MRQGRKPAGSPGGSGGQFDSTGGKYRPGLPAFDNGPHVSGACRFAYAWQTADWDGIDWDNTTPMSSPVKLNHAELRGRNLVASDFGDAVFKDVDFYGADLSGSRMTANISRSNFENAHLEETRWGPFSPAIAEYDKWADVLDTSFSNAKMKKACLWWATLERCDFSGADLMGASFKEADLTDCSFRDANLSHVDLDGAKLERVDLTGTDLTGAHLGAHYLAGDIPLDNACLKDTRFDDISGFTLNGRQVTEDELRKRGAYFIKDL